jgi:hypothetical protein
MNIFSKVAITLLIVNFTIIVKAQNTAITDDATYSPNSSAMLDVKSTTKGLLIPRLTTAQRTAITTPATSLLVFDTNLNGYYYYNGTTWINLSSGSSSAPFWSYTSPYIYNTTLTDDVGIGVNTPLHKLHIRETNTTIDGTDGTFIDIQNYSNTTGVLSGIRFGNNSYNNIFKSGIFYKSTRSYNRGDLILTNNSTASYTNATTSDARVVLENTGRVMVKGDPNTTLESAIFAVQNSDGDTIFAVYPQGVRINVYDDPLAKAASKNGGFAVGGFKPAKGTLTQEYFRVSPDSVRVYIEEGNVGKSKGSKGGFAVGGFKPAKGTTTDYFNIFGANAADLVNPSQARIFWYPIKEAFLSGRVLVESADSVGTNSFASGFESKAIGNYSQALGYKSRAKGNNSTAIGNNASAEGTESYALGNYAKTSNVGSYAFGSGSRATGLRSFAIGSTGVDSAGVSTNATVASGNYSYAFGMGSTSSGKGAFSFGTQNTASGDYSLALGYKNSSSAYGCVTIGDNNTATGLLGYGISIGKSNASSGFIGIGIAIGMNNNVTGSYTCAAIGYNNFVSGINSYAFGSVGSVGNSSTAVSNSVLFNLDNNTPASLMADNVFSIISASVGIGTTSPNSKLHINGLATEDPLRVQVNGSSKLYVNTNGGTSIGSSTAAPTNGLYVSGYTGLGSSTPGTHRLYVSSSITGAAGAAGYFINTAAAGIALSIENSSTTASDAVFLASQKGSTGDIAAFDSYHGTGSWDREFRFTNTGDGRCDGSWVAGGADYAEYFPKADISKKYELGDVMIISSKGYSVEITNNKYSDVILGVYSSNPAVIGNSSAEKDPENSVLVGLLGVIPTKVCTENGEIKVGDFLTTSSTSGVAMKATKPGMIIGKALENYTENSVGKIKVMVNPIWSGRNLE